jgi:hypothetical protein
MRALAALVVGIAMGLVGCAGGANEAPPVPASPSAPATDANGSVFVLPYQLAPASRYPILADGTLGPPEVVPWESGPDAEATLLKDAVGPRALTATIEPPLTDVSRTKQLQVRDVTTGAVLHELDAHGWCSGPDGASYVCLLLDEGRVVRSTPLDGERPGAITVTSTVTGESLAEYGPFAGLAAVYPTDVPDAVVLVTFDPAGEQHRFQRLDTQTAATSDIGTISTSQPWLCILGNDSVLTYGTSLQAIGPAAVAPVEVAELGSGGPGVQGCSADGRSLYVRTDFELDLEQPLVLDAIDLVDGSRAHALTLPPGSQAHAIWVTR